MDKTKITINHKMRNFYSGSFINEDYKTEWTEFVPNTKDFAGNPLRYDHGTFASEDGIEFSVYDGAQNYMGFVNRISGKISDEKDEYKLSFLKSAKKKICGE